MSLLAELNKPNDWLKIFPRGFLYSATGARQIFLFIAEKEDITFPVWVGGSQGWPGRGEQIHSSITFVRHKLLKSIDFKISRCLFYGMNGHQIQTKLILINSKNEEITFEDSLAAILPLCLAGECDYFATRDLIEKCRTIDMGLHQMEFGVATESQTESKILM